MSTNQESLIRTIAKMDETIRKRDEQIQALRMECRDLARELAEAKPEPRPLAVGDRVRVVTPEYAGGMKVGALAVGDVGEVTQEADDVGDIGFLRDGTEGGWYVAAANVERIEDDRPAACCGKCPPIAGGGYDCTCEGNPWCSKQVTA